MIFIFYDEYYVLKGLMEKQLHVTPTIVLQKEKILIKAFDANLNNFCTRVNFTSSKLGFIDLAMYDL